MTQRATAFGGSAAGPTAFRLDRRKVATAVASFLFAMLLISFRPFQPTGALSSDGAAPLESGDLVNQLGYLSLGLIAIFSLFSLVEPRRLAALLSPWWLLLFAFMALSVVIAPDPSAPRAAIFTLLAVICAAAVVTLPQDGQSYAVVVAVAALSVVCLSYVGLVLAPSAAMHTAAGPEPEHAGLWRGVFSHKNIAGPVMACCCFVGLYLWRRGWTRTGMLLFAGALLFVVQTGSKTTAGLVPLTVLLVMGPGLIGMRLLTVFLVACSFVLTGLGTVGIVFIESIGDLANAYFPGLDYTGRTTLWAFAGEMIARQPWLGYGYLSFWGTPIVLGQDVFFDQAWDIRGSVHGHEGYLDIALQMGLPAMFVAIVAFVIVPLRDYMRIPLYRENVLLGDLFLMIIQFTTLNAFLESFFLRRADPVWMLLVVGLFGIRLVARFPVPARGALP